MKAVFCMARQRDATPPIPIVQSTGWFYMVIGTYLWLVLRGDLFGSGISETFHLAMLRDTINGILVAFKLTQIFK